MLLRFNTFEIIIKSPLLFLNTRIVDNANSVVTNNHILTFKTDIHSLDVCINLILSHHIKITKKLSALIRKPGRAGLVGF